MSDDHAESALTGCDMCDRHGPELTKSDEELLRLHRAFHDLARHLADTVYEWQVGLHDSLTRRISDRKEQQ